jgi:hypothetical protein
MSPATPLLNFTTTFHDIWGSGFSLCDEDCVCVFTYVKRKKETERRGQVVNTPTLYLGFLGSNLSLETGCPDRGFCGFPQSLQVNTGIVP